MIRSASLMVALSIGSAAAPVAAQSHSSSSAVVTTVPSIEVQIRIRSPIRIRVRYPRFTASGTATEWVNGVVRARATAIAHANVRDARRDWEFLRDRPRSELGAETICSVAFASDTFVSIGCDQIVSVGGAHPIKHFESLNLDVTRQRVVTLTDFFRPGARVRHQLLRRVTPALERVAGAMAAETLAYARFDAFTVTPNALHMVFRDDFPFVVASVAEADVPWRSVRGSLREDGPAARLGVDP